MGTVPRQLVATHTKSTRVWDVLRSPLPVFNLGPRRLSEYFMNEPALEIPLPHSTAAAATPLDGWDLLLSANHRLETDIERLYLRRGAPEMRARFAVPLLHLAQIERATIARLADAVGVTHSAMSQTVDAMGRFGWTATGRGRDGRIRVVELTDAGRAVLPALERVRRAVAQSLGDIDGSLPAAPSSLGLGLASALRQRSLYERVVAQLDSTAAD